MALAEQARLVRIQRAPNHRDLRRQIPRALRRDHSAYWEAIAEGPERVAGNFIRCWKMSATGRSKWVRTYLNVMEASFQTKQEGYVVGKSTSGNFSIMQHPRNHPPSRTVRM